MSKTRRTLSIHFIDGNSVAFDFPQQGDMSTITQRVEGLLKHQYLMVEAEGSVMLYPLANVRSLQLFPAPDVLPENCIKGARIAD